MSQSDKWMLILWQRKDKIRGCFKNSTSSGLQRCQNKICFQRKGSSVVLEFLLYLLKGYQCYLFVPDHFLFFKECNENFNTMPEPLLYFDIAGEQ